MQLRPTLQSHPNLLNVRLLDSLPMPMLRRMMRTGIAIDLPKLKGLSTQMGERMRELEVEVRKHVPQDKWNEFVGKDSDADEQPGLVVEEKQRELPQINVNSAEQMAWFLFDVLGLGAGRNLKRTADGHRISTGKKQLELLKEEHGVIQLLLEYRENHKLKTTYADALPKKARLHPKGKCPICSSLGDPVHHLESHHRIHTTFTSTRTETGRYASKSPNLQNIPARSELGELIRSSFIASPGYKLVSADHSQIELRTLAHCAGDRLMRKIFREGGDIHDRTTAGIFKLTKVDKAAKLVVAADGSVIDWHHYSARMRAPMKNINFGICIAEGTPILTSAGLVPIEKVTKQMLVWDGIDYVPHHGVIFKGNKETITHDGLTATPDHKVWLECGTYTTLREAAARGARLAIGGTESTPVRHSANYLASVLGRRLSLCGHGLLSLREGQAHLGRQHQGSQNTRLHMREEVRRSTLLRSGRALYKHRPALHQSQVSLLPELWSAWYSERVRESGPLYPIRFGDFAASYLSAALYRQERQRRELRAWESAAGYVCREQPESAQQPMGRVQRAVIGGSRHARRAESRLPGLQTHASYDCPVTVSRHALAGATYTQATRPVYDILNAGPRRRFTAAGKIVSNCYGLTPIGLQAQLALSGIYLSEDECAQLIAQWFGFYTSVLPYMNEQHYRAKHYGLVWDMWGRVRYTPGVYSVHPKSVAEALREAGNQPIQAGATGMMKLGMWDMWCRDLEAFRGEIEVNPLLTVHDELIEEAPEHFAESLLDLNVQLMCDVAELAVPIGAAGSAGYCWEK